MGVFCIHTYRHNNNQRKRGHEFESEKGRYIGKVEES